MIVHQTTRAPATQPVAQWLSQMLDPVVLAVRLTTPPPLEIRPTGRWGGWCSDQSQAPDCRVAISNQIIFWTAENIKSVYMHEVAHRLLCPHKVQTHSAEFFCLNAALLLRAEKFFDANPLLKLSLYDLQDTPSELENHPQAHTTAMAWALAEAPKLAESALTAEELAAEVVKSWKQHIKRIEASKKAEQRAEQAAQDREAKMANTIENLRFWVIGLPILVGVMSWLLRIQ